MSDPELELELEVEDAGCSVSTAVAYECAEETEVAREREFAGCGGITERVGIEDVAVGLGIGAGGVVEVGVSSGISDTSARVGVSAAGLDEDAAAASEGNSIVGLGGECAPAGRVKFCHHEPGLARVGVASLFKSVLLLEGPFNVPEGPITFFNDDGFDLEAP